MISPYEFASLICELPEMIRGKSRCFLHDCPLKVGLVPIIYGYPYDDTAIATGRSCPETEDFARRLAFPYARSFDLGGCRAGMDRFRFAWYCTRCRSSELKWHQVESRTRITWLKTMIDEVSPGELKRYGATENLRNRLRDSQLSGTVKEHSDTEKQLSAKLDSWIQSQGVKSDKTMHDIMLGSIGAIIETE